MRARSSVLIVLMGVVIVGASASVWLPRISRRLSLIRRQVKQETGLAKMPNDQTFKIGARIGPIPPGWKDTPTIKYLGPIPKGWKPPAPVVIFPPELTESEREYVEVACLDRQACEQSLANEVFALKNALNAWQKETTELQRENSELRFAGQSARTAAANAYGDAEEVSRMAAIDKAERHVEKTNKAFEDKLDAMIQRSNLSDMLGAAYEEGKNAGCR